MLECLAAIWVIIQLAVGYNLLFPFFLLLIYSFSKKRRLKDVPNQTQPDYAIIVTAYQYLDTLPEAVASILNLNYDNFLVYVVADNCDVTSLHFDDNRVIILKPDEVLKSNVKSHFYAIDRFHRDHDILTIIDSDNLVDPEYLNQLNTYFSEGFEAVQGCREAKNLDTLYACLDAARDIYYHFYDCRLLFNCGSSSTLSGSGMAFTTKLYKDCLGNADISGAGFDKVLQASIVEKNKRIAFAPHAIVYDQKTSAPDQLVNQRSRWINTWFRYFALGFTLVASGVKKASTNQLLFGLVLLRPPLFLFLVLSLMMLVLNLVFSPLISLFWLLALAIFIGCFIKALVSSDSDKRIYQSLWGIPKFVYYQLISLSKIRKANTRSVSTRHTHI